MSCGIIDSSGKGDRLIPASDTALSYSGRWDLRDPESPRASWPGFAVSTEFQGQSIYVRMKDPGNYFNVEIDGKHHRVIGGKRGGHATYQIAKNLGSGVHLIRLQRRNISFGDPTVIEGFIVDQQAQLTQPATSAKMRIEFIGDSFTAAEGNEARSSTLAWRKKFPVTNFASGYAAVLGRALNAEVTAICRSGSGVLTTWNGNRKHPMPERYGWTLMEDPEVAWHFDAPSPDLVVICLGLNDSSGLKEADGSVSPRAVSQFQTAYLQLIREVLRRHPQTKIVALAPFTPWLRESISHVVAKEKAHGNRQIHYAQFDYLEGGYVADGHPTVATHRKMAGQILDQFVSLGLAPEGTTLTAE
jgi:lysophospholipase L1-like esterase